MKVLLVVQNYYPSIGGTQILFQTIAEKLVSDFGDDVEVFTTNSHYPPEKKYFKRISIESEEINAVKVRRFGFVRWHLVLFRFTHKLINRFLKVKASLLARYIFGPWSASLMKAIRSTDADIIVAGTSGYLYMHYPLQRFNQSNAKPFIFHGAVHFTENRSLESIQPRTVEAIKQSEYYLANTSYELNRLTELGVREANIVVTGCGVDADAFASGDRNRYRKRFNLCDDDLLVGYIGRIEPTKGIELLLDAFQKINPEKNIYLVIAGYPNEEYISQLRGAYLKDAKKIHLIGKLSMEEKAHLFHALDIFVLPSASESFGIVFLEAWCCKKPVIGASIGAVRCVVDDGKDGVLFTPGDAGDLCKKILLLAGDALLRHQFGINGYKKVMDNYTWDIVMKKYRDTCIKAIQKFALRDENIA